MLSIKRARHLIEADPTSSDAKALAELVLALENGSTYRLEGLYELKLETFEIAVEMLSEWRLARYFGGKTKLLNAVLHMNEINEQARQENF